MSLQSPPRLLELAGQNLVRNEALVMPPLEEVPVELFPPLFMEAFNGRRSEILKAMVQAWPFFCLPLGSLMKTPDLETLRVVLEGLDVLLAQKVRPRRWILQVLDLRNVDENFWVIESEAMTHACLPNAMSKRKTVKSCPSMGRQQPLKVFIDLCLEERPLDEFLTYLFLWVKQRKDLVHLCCTKLSIFATRIQKIRTVLRMVELDCIQVVEVNCNWKLSMLARFAPYLGEMINLRKLLLLQIYVSNLEKKDRFIAQFTTQFRKLDHLQRLYMNSVSFLEGHLDQVLRCLKTPLETLSITNCLLSESDLMDLSQCPSISQLKNLVLSGITLSDFSPEPLHLLLEKVAATLQTLDLDECGITDAQLAVILPALSRCTQLTTLSFCGNHISKATLENLLRHTHRLSELSLELYDVPLESYSAGGTICWRKLARFRAELRQLLKDLQQPKRILFSTALCPRCGRSAFYDLDLGQSCCSPPA
ncbi:PRAME family member 12-like [Lemur catta]|uniref:PRAME family member 12-like n=1 Tax=Lemur catta TaxID=9447 RepID=UPI001E26B16A|nr:PRAME family member 12-like [Lemur catta]